MLTSGNLKEAVSEQINNQLNEIIEHRQTEMTKTIESAKISQPQLPHSEITKSDKYADAESIPFEEI